MPYIRVRVAASIAFLSLMAGVACAQETKPAYPSFDFETARAHEIKPHRRTIPTEGVRGGFNQLHIKLIVSPAGEVTHTEASGNQSDMDHWLDVQPEVASWKFTPFEKDGKAVMAEVEEYVDLVPPERLPKTHVKPPEIRSDSAISIKLERSGCYGSCPSYSVTLSTIRITFDGGGYVVARGKHTDKVNSAGVRDLARRFVNADFYSMDSEYQASVTDNPGYTLAITINGQTKQVNDYVGSWVGMPAVITELEHSVDDLAQTKRWIEGSDGLIDALKAEKYNFKSYDAQVMIKEAARRGQAGTVQDLLDSGVPLKPYPAPKPKDETERPAFEHVGWLNAASGSPETLQVLIDAGASEHDQTDKNLALHHAVQSGKIASVRALIDYGANPNANLDKELPNLGIGQVEDMPKRGASILASAAASGDPETLSEILRYNPDMNGHDLEGRSSLFAAIEYRYGTDGALRAECVRLLIKAGADVNERNEDGDTSLHVTYVTEVEEELLKLGADVNARNNDGETPIFTTDDDDAISLYIEHGADLSIRNNAGQTVIEAAEEKGPQRVEALRKAIEERNRKLAAN